MTLMVELVAAHSGRIDFDSRPRLGTTFSVLLPITAAGDGLTSGAA